MKRNMETVRLILQWVESGEKPGELEAVEESERIYHIDIMIEAGLLKGVTRLGAHGEPVSARIHRMTWEGHDFLDATKDPGIWEKAKAKVLKSGASWTFGILVEFLKAEAKSHLHLP